MFTISALCTHRRVPLCLMQEFPSVSMSSIYGCKVGAVHETMLMLTSDWLEGNTFFFGTLKSNLKLPNGGQQ